MLTNEEIGEAKKINTKVKEEIKKIRRSLEILRNIKQVEKDAKNNIMKDFEKELKAKLNILKIEKLVI